MSISSRKSTDNPRPVILSTSPDNIAQAAALIDSGELVAFPTETVYGLGGDATNDTAVATIFEAKGRPRFNPLIVHFAETKAATKEVDFNSLATQLAEAFWPGALTLILPRAKNCRISLLTSAGLDTLAVRVPGHKTARAFLSACASPVAAPSANKSVAISPTTAAHVAQSLGGNVTAIIDDGPCRIGIESTVLDLSGEEPVLLRPGGVTVEEIETIIGHPLRLSAPTAKSDGTEPLKSPGTMAAHYAPGLPLRLNISTVEKGEALLAFGPHTLSGFTSQRNLSPSGDLKEAAANFFAMLRDLDKPEFVRIAVMTIPNTGLGQAINDRLARAAFRDLEATQ